MSRAIVLAVAVLATASSLAIALLVFDGIPHVADGISYTFQGRLLAAGRVCLEPPPTPDLFLQQKIILDGERWCSQYPPGWPVLLAVGHWLRAPWALNPILLGVSVVLVFLLGSRLYDPVTGVVAAVALTVSPFALVGSAGFMSHPAALAAALASLLALVRAVQEDDLAAAALGAAFAGFMFLTRPFSAVALLAPAALWCLWRLRARAPRAVGAMLLGVAPFLLLNLGYQWLAYGSPWTAGYLVYDPTLRFNGSGGERTDFTVLFADGFPWYWWQLAHSLWGHPWPDWLLPALGLGFGAVIARGREASFVLGACALALITGYSFYYFHDVAFGGPRLVFEALGPFALLSGHAVMSVHRLLAQLAPSRVVYLAAGVVGAVLLLPPLLSRLPEVLRYHDSWFHGQSGDLLDEIERAGVGERALVLYSGSSFAFGNLLLQNAIDPFEGDRIFVRDIPAHRAATFARAGTREHWQLQLRLEPLPGINSYRDRWKLGHVTLHKLDGSSS